MSQSPNTSSITQQSALFFQEVRHIHAHRLAFWLRLPLAENAHCLYCWSDQHLFALCGFTLNFLIGFRRERCKNQSHQHQAMRCFLPLPQPLAHPQLRARRNQRRYRCDRKGCTPCCGALIDISRCGRVIISAQPLPLT